MLHRLGLINKNQRGFTLLELLIAATIVSFVIGGTTMTIFQIFSGNIRSSNHMTAIRQVQNAGYWVSHDAQMAQDVAPAEESVDDPDGTRFPLTLTWTDWSSDEHEVTYNIVDNKLTRSYSVNEGEASQTLIAKFIDSTNTSCYKNEEGILTLTITAKLGAGSQVASETRVYEVIPRPDSG